MVNVDELIHWVNLSFHLEPWQERVLRDMWTEEANASFRKYMEQDGDE